MNNSYTVDYTYLALELTKVRHKDTFNCDVNDQSIDRCILQTYLYYIEELKGISLEELDKLPELKKELENIKIKYNDLLKAIDKEVQKQVDTKNNKAIEFLNESKGDMEPAVYTTLIHLLSQ